MAKTSPPKPRAGHKRLKAFLGKWKSEGRQHKGPDLAGKTVKVRCTIVFSDAGKTRTGKWESSSDGSTWTTFWDVESKKSR